MQDSPFHDQDFSLDPALRRRRLWAYFSRYKGLFFAGAFFLLLTNLLALGIPYLLGQAVQLLRDADIALEAANFADVRSQVIRIAGFIILLAIGSGTARVFSRITIFNAGRYIEFDMRNELYTHLARLSPRFYSSISTGDLTSRVTNDVTYVRLLYAIPFLHLINAIIAYGIAIQRMLYLDWKLTLICLAPYPVLLFGLRRIIYSLFHQTKAVQQELSNLSSRVQENLSGVDVIKSYVLREREITAYQEHNDSFFHENVLLARIRALFQAIIILIASSGTLLVLLLGSQRVIKGTMSLGTFVEFNGYVVALVFPTVAMGWVFSVWHRGLAGFDRISQVLEYEPILTDPEGAPGTLPAPSPEQKVGEIRLQNMTFGYGDTPTLKNISMQIPAGSTVAIVGKTGSGKSTLAKLLARMYDPDEGQILLDGIPLDQLPLRELRAQMGVVPQEPFLFSMTIGQNIRFGLDALAYDETLPKSPPQRSLLASDTEDPDSIVDQTTRIDEAIQIAALKTDLEAFKDGLNTLVGERGVTLSGGQKQRATIARALLVDPRVLILDDALASVDTRTERKILDHLRTIMAGRTSILITHRFNALNDVDHIFVLDQGRLVEQGTHQELVALGGHYAEIYERQRLQEQFQS